MTEATAFLMTGEKLDYLYALLHTKVLTYAFKTFYAGGGLGETAFRYKKVFLENLPIPKQNLTLIRKVEVIIKKLLSCNKEVMQQLTDEIDALVYDVYNFSNAEIEIIKKSATINKD